MNRGHIERVVRGMREKGLTHILVSDPLSLYYLAGLDINPGERLAVLLLNEDGQTEMIANRLFALSAEADCPLIDYDDTEDCMAVLSERIPKDAVLGIDKNWPSHFLIDLMNRRGDIVIRHGSVPVDEARMVKDAEELAAMRESSRLNDAVLEKLMASVRIGETEKQLAVRYSELALAMGAQGNSFEPLICFGPHCAEPHHISDDTPLRTGDAVIFDVGLNLRYAMSDMTRTVFFGTPTEEQARVYSIVREAFEAAVATVRPGIPLSEVDRAARRIIEAAGYGDYFIHRTGHGIGLSEHEPPDVSAVSRTIAREGMVFSIEPGIYLPGKFGVRLENLAAVTKDGCEVLNSLPFNKY